jgi:hypothetical protein
VSIIVKGVRVVWIWLLLLFDIFSAFQRSQKWLSPEKVHLSGVSTRFWYGAYITVVHWIDSKVPFMGTAWLACWLAQYLVRHYPSGGFSKIQIVKIQWSRIQIVKLLLFFLERIRSRNNSNRISHSLLNKLDIGTYCTSQHK